MAYKKITLEELVSLDGGRLREAFEQALARAVDDCKDRPLEKRPRNVTMTLALRPLADDKGDLETVNIAFDFDDRYPKRRSRSYNAKPVPGGLVVNEDSPDDVKQLTLDMSGKTKPKAVANT